MSMDKLTARGLLDGLQPKTILYALANTNQVWRQRASIVATQPLIQSGDFTDIQALAEHFMHHPHDLIHKAGGWMLREMGQKNVQTLKTFLNRNANQMPRTMLRYAIEHFPDTDRRRYLKLKRGES